MNSEKTNIVVFNISTPLTNVVSLINKSINKHPFLCLTTHRLYKLEEIQILKSVPYNIFFRCFADFMTDEEMSCCDKYAYEMICCNSSIPSLKAYYETIKTLKNELILEKIKKSHDLAEKHLCADDLGIKAGVWLDDGFIDEVELTPKKLNPFHEPVHIQEDRNISSLIGRKLKQFVAHIGILTKDIYLLQTGSGNYIFLGSIMRIRPHLDGFVIKPIEPSKTANIIYLLPLLTHSLLAKINLSSKALNRFVEWLQLICTRRTIRECARSQNVSILLSSMHEYNLYRTKLAEDLNMKFVICQDGFLPENYSSEYVKFFRGVEEFWVWDRLSLGLFNNQKHKAKVSPLFSVAKLPVINNAVYKVKTILVVTSGAGDWTAVKNRSDEDLMVIAFMKVAELFPDIEIVYRCHPLWVHPEHQGINSISRVNEYFKQVGLKNISVSGESLVQSFEYRNSGVQGVPPASLAQDLEKADIVFGEHSIAMIDGALQGKLFASINLTKRRDFFHAYTKLGFLHCTSIDDIVNLIKMLHEKPEDIIYQHNSAVRTYNQEYSQ